MSTGSLGSSEFKDWFEEGESAKETDSPVMQES